MKILIIEDDDKSAGYVVNGLREAGYTVDRAADGKEGMYLAADGGYDLLVVDRMLPGMDGLAVVAALRGTGVHTPVLFLTALSGIEERVSGLDAGGDDYLAKPFSFAELQARVRALLRRPAAAVLQTVLQVADLEMDLVKRTVSRAGRPISLQPREFRLLEYLMRHAGEVVTRTMLLEQVWDFHFDPQTNVVETHISRLRTKVDKPFQAALIHTLRGAGYCLRAAG
jgi:two-component system OmpR family response regulator